MKKIKILSSILAISCVSISLFIVAKKYFTFQSLNEACPDNQILLEYDISQYQSDETVAQYFTALKDLTPRCAKQLSKNGERANDALINAGYLSLITNPVIYNLIDAMNVDSEAGFHYYFRRDENLLKYVKDLISKYPEKEEELKKIYDFILTAPYSNLDNDKTIYDETYKKSYDRERYALFLPIWQNSERRTQFTNLCQKLGCNLEKYDNCKPEYPMSIKKVFIDNNGDIIKTIEKCNIIITSTNAGEGMKELQPFETAENIYLLNRIGLLNPECYDNQVDYILKNGVMSLKNCQMQSKAHN